MSEAGDYVPAAHWSGYDFASARRAYASVIDRSYDDAVAKNVGLAECVPENLETDAEAPLVIACDVTGSMGEWPATIFSKLPYLEYEGQEYLGDNMQISFAAIGDSHGDKYPLQVRPFVRGKGLKDELEKLIHEGGGGGSSEESYDICALYYARNVKTPQAIRKPILIFIGDEGIYSVMSSRAEDWGRAKIDKKTNPRVVFEELTQKFSVYIVRKPYNCSENHSSPSNDRIQRQWEEFLGEDRVISLPDPKRVVDVIFGILAKETGRIDYFEGELRDRQGKDADGDKKIEVVLKSLHSVHKIPKASAKKLEGPKGGGKSKSVSLRKGGGSKSISLLD